MLNFYAGKFVEIARKINKIQLMHLAIENARLNVELQRNIDVQHDHILSYKKDKILFYMKELHELCVQMRLNNTKVLSGMILERLEHRYANGQFTQDFNHLQELLEKDFSERFCFIIPEEKADFYNSDSFFGTDVYINFPSIRSEIAEAGKSYALGLNTACVFHLMRAAEIVLKRMVVVMKATTYLLINGKKVSPDVCDWDTLLKALRSALNNMAVGKKTSAKVKATHAFYSEAVNTFIEMKDAWRNTISHGHEVSLDGRKLFKEGETEDIIKSTRHFLTHLAKRIKE